MTFYPKHYASNEHITASGATTVSVPAMQIRIDETSLESFSPIALDCETGASWDSISVTDYTDAANRVGLDVYIYACIPELGKTPKLLLSANATFPDGYDADTSRKIGGFHCECANVGTIANHPLSGLLAGSIISTSVWDLKHRCANHNNAGMVYDDITGKWYGIYLPSLSGSNAVSVYGGTISGNEWWWHVDACANSSTRLLKDHEFVACATGSPEGTNIFGSVYPVTTGGHVNTSSVRIISHIGCEDCTGVRWQWLDEQGYQFGPATNHTHSVTARGEAETATSGTDSVDVAPAWSWKNVTGGKGQLYTQGTYGTTKMWAGGKWDSGSYSGTLSRDVSQYQWAAYYNYRSCRFCCESKEL